MMVNLLMRFLPEDKRGLLELAMRMVANLDTPAERKAVAEYGIKMIEGGVTVNEWATFGKKLGVFKMEKGNKK
tara:strand:- start:567 stop:785 length:219 start_codon:yes stop_codon:yes gene_type:complete